MDAWCPAAARAACLPCDALSAGVMQRYRWVDARTGPDSAPRPLRIRLPAGATVPPHDHDFAEVTWIDAGDGLDRDARGSHRVDAQVLILHRPQDGHALVAGAHGLVLTNAILPVQEVEAVLGRRGLSAGDWSGHHRLSASMRALVIAAATVLVERPIDALARELLILAVVAVLRRVEPAPYADCPPWLADACLRMEHPENFRAGVARLVALSGRSREHVARSLRRHAGRTTSQVVAEARLRHASALLAAEETPVTTIALTCGWSSLAGFYTAFRARYGCSPGRWRQRQQVRLPVAGG